MSRRLTLAALALTFAALSWNVQAQDSASKVDKIFARIEENKGATLWDDVRDLREVAREAMDNVRQGLTRADANVRIAAAAEVEIEIGVTRPIAGVVDDLVAQALASAI